MNAAHLHLIFNHIPVLGSYAILLLTALAVSTKNQSLAKLTLQAMVLFGVAALATYLTGEPAEELIEHLPGFDESFIERHEKIALYGLVMTELLAVIGVLGLLKGRRSDGFLIKYWKPIVLIALINAGLMATTANFGGEIRHTEIRATEK